MTGQAGTLTTRSCFKVGFATAGQHDTQKSFELVAYAPTNPSPQDHLVVVGGDSEVRVAAQLARGGVEPRAMTTHTDRSFLWDAHKINGAGVLILMLKVFLFMLATSMGTQGKARFA